jgi:uncharacterized protein with PQ loop repeat
MGKHEELVGIAGVLGLISFSTLVQTVYTSHNTTSLPWSWVIINITAQVLSLVYGLVNNAYGIYIPNFLFLAGLVYIMYVKLNHAKYEKNKPKQI